MDDMLKDKLTKICLCRGITKHTIKQAILDGANTIEDVKKQTGATAGGCGGKRCKDKIIQMIEELK